MADKKKSFFNGRKTWFAFAAVSALTTAFVIANLLSTVASDSSYWVVDEDAGVIEARTPITPDMLKRVSVPSASLPPNALEIAAIQEAFDTADTSDDIYSIYRLQPGDVLTTSNAGMLTTLSSEVFEGSTKVAASFKVSPSLAAGGNVKSGDLVDIAVIYEDGGTLASRFFLTNIPIVSATVDLDGRSPDDEGAPVLYVVAVTPTQAADIAVAAQYSMYVVLSAPDGEPNNAGSNLSDILGLTQSGGGGSGSILDPAPDGGQGGNLPEDFDDGTNQEPLPEGEEPIEFDNPDDANTANGNGADEGITAEPAE